MPLELIAKIKKINQHHLNSCVTVKDNNTIHIEKKDSDPIKQLCDISVSIRIKRS